MTKPVDSLWEKVDTLFTELVGERAKQLAGPGTATASFDAIVGAIVKEYGPDKANAIAFNMTDWCQEAAFIVALHLFSERFTPEEIDVGIHGYLHHAGYHLDAALKLWEGARSA